ncbi:MAG: class I SAM-dependent methyltransferase [Christensenellaceae bacterium]|nr:class I SAM-dependent methyltransferase [Christensenellaceae bacterium]
MYADFALVYDRLMADVDYISWVELYKNLLFERGVKNGASIVECACGTGNLSLPLSECFSVSGVDISEDMLSVAHSKARSHGKRINFIRQDMRELSFHKKQDAVLATCDGVNYLDSTGFISFLESAYSLLNFDGVIAFDASTPYKLQEILGNNTFTLVEDDICYIWQNFWDEDNQKVILSLDIFTKTGDKYLRIKEEQQQWAHDVNFIEDSLKNAGFADIEFCNMQGETISESDERIFAVAVKRRNNNE